MGEVQLLQDRNVKHRNHRQSIQQHEERLRKMIKWSLCSIWFTQCTFMGLREQIMSVIRSRLVIVKTEGHGRRALLS